MFQSPSFHWMSFSTFLLAGGLAFVAGCSDGSGSGGSIVGGDDDTASFRYRCEVSFRVGGPEGTFEEVAVSADFASSLGTFLVDSSGARCDGKLPRLAAGEREGPNNNPDEPEMQRRIFSVTVDDVQGIDLPADLATCVFLAREETHAEDLGLLASVWQPVATTEVPTYANRPEPSAEVQCTELSVSPESTTTTTLDECAAVECESGQECHRGACVSLETGILQIYLDSAAEDVGSVQLQIDYGNSGASFTHEAGQRACRRNPDATRWLYADCDFRPAGGCEVSHGFHPGELGIGIASLEPFQGPILLASCEIAAEDLDDAVAAMRVEPIEIANPDNDPVDGQLSIRLVAD